MSPASLSRLPGTLHSPGQSLSLPTSPSSPHGPGRPHRPGPQQPAPPSLPHSVLETAPARTPGDNGGSAAQHWPVQDRHALHSGQDCMSYVCFGGPGHIPSLLLCDGEWGLWLRGVGWQKSRAAAGVLATRSDHHRSWGCPVSRAPSSPPRGEPGLTPVPCRQVLCRSRSACGSVQTSRSRGQASPSAWGGRSWSWLPAPHGQARRRGRRRAEERSEGETRAESRESELIGVGGSGKHPQPLCGRGRRLEGQSLTHMLAA